MDELIGRLVANLGVDRAAAEKASGIVLDFRAEEAPADNAVGEVVAAIPGFARLV